MFRTTRIENRIIVLAASVAVLIFIGMKQTEKRRQIMNKEDITVTVNEDLINMVSTMRKTDKKVTNNANLNEHEKKELTNRFKAMTKDELELFMDLVPIELCLNRIQKELDKSKAFEEAIKAATAGLK